MIEGRLPTVPEYYKEFIDGTVNLAAEPKQCCPFHSEDTPSFSYDRRTDRWSCFGACHAHGDVIDMHNRVFHFGDRKVAEKDLYQRCKIKYEPKPEKVGQFNVDKTKVDNNALYVQACSLANTPDRWVELDEVMSKYPFQETEVLGLVWKWTGKESLI